MRTDAPPCSSLVDRVYSYLTDQIGSVYAFADEMGQIAEAYDYDAYGMPYLLDPGQDGILFTADDERLPFVPGARTSLLVA